MCFVSPYFLSACVYYNCNRIIFQLSKIEGIDANLIDSYKNRLYENNISGRVLQTCDLQELREIMKMSFGDWQLFMTWVTPLRCRKSQLNHRYQIYDNVTLTIKSIMIKSDI